MSTDKLQAVSNTVEEILSEPLSPHTYFDEDPAEAEQASERVAKVSNNLGPGPEISKENFGRLNSRKFGISPIVIHDAQVVRDPKNESVSIARQTLADQIPVSPEDHAGIQQVSMLSHETASARSDPGIASTKMFRRADSGNGISLGGWRLRGFAIILLAAAIGVASVVWLGSSPNAAKTAPSQPGPLVQIAPTVPTELTSLLQSISRDLVNVGKEIEQLKAGSELMVRDNANFSEQLKASQEQLTRVVARLSEQLKTDQEQARDNATVAEQIKGIQDKLARVISQASEQKMLPKIAATSPRLLPRPARPEGPAALKPVPTVSSAPASAKPKAERPKLSSAPRQPVTVR
jgi:hypothetical protein